MSPKPRILFVTPRVPAPGVYGDQLRAWHFLKHMAREHRVTLVCLDDGNPDAGHGNLSRDIVEETIFVGRPRSQAAAGALLSLARGGPAQVGWFDSRALHGKLRELVSSGRYRAAFVQMARLNGAIEALRPLPVVLDFVDALSMQWVRRATRGSLLLRTFNKWEAARLTELEKKLRQRCAACIITGEDDARWLREKDPDSRPLFVVPNGVDMELFQPLEKAVVNDRPRIIFSGNLDYSPNHQAVLFFAREVLPLLRRTHPEVRFIAAGKLEGAALRKEGEALGVEFTGYVDDLGKEIASADVAVTPMVSGAGIQNKVLEAMATGTPVVSTRLANAAIGAAHGREILIGASPEALAGHVRALLDNPEMRAEVGEAGREFVQREFSWQAQAAVVSGHLLDAEKAGEGGATRRALRLTRSSRGSRRERWQCRAFGMVDKAIQLLVIWTLLMLYLPLLPFLALAIKLTSPGSVFYSQERLGVDRRDSPNPSYGGEDRRRQNLGGRPFTIHKLRTMRSDAEEKTGPVWAAKNDPRVTSVGRLLRKTRLDEVPQLWNVLKGDMGLVGPRPERPHFVQELKETHPGYAYRLHHLKPGLTGLAQVHGTYDTTVEDVEEKLLLDNGYRLRAGHPRDRLVTNMEILMRTVTTVLTGKGAH